jgi:hypothetical protein
MQLLRNSGYEPTFRIEVLNSGLTAYNRILEADLAGKKPMYRSREWKKTAQGMEYQKCRKSKNWLGSYKSCIFVPPTPDSELQKLMQAKKKELRAGGREKFPIKIIETVGKPLESILVKSDPFDGNKCSDETCQPNRNKQNKISCCRNNVGYEIKCKICHWDGGSEVNSAPKGASYFGETGENMHTRMKSHESKFRSKTLKVREGSAFYIHMVNEHPETELEGKSIDIFFEVKILKAYQKVLTRLVTVQLNSQLFS